MTAADPAVPETVTIPGPIALETLALLDAFCVVAAEFRLDREAEPFYVIEHPLFDALLAALGHPRGEDLDTPLCDAMYSRSRELQKVLLSHFDAPAHAAIVATKTAHDISEVKARMEYSLGR